MLLNNKTWPNSKNRYLCRENTIKISYHLCEIQETKRFSSKGMLPIDFSSKEGLLRQHGFMTQVNFFLQVGQIAVLAKKFFFANFIVPHSHMNM